MTVDVWVVLIEAADNQSTGRVTYESVQRLLGELASHRPSGLYAPDRYAVQLVVQTARPTNALNQAVRAWEEAVGSCGLPPWPLVRAEVKTLAELESEIHAEAALVGTAQTQGAEGACGGRFRCLDGPT